MNVRTRFAPSPTGALHAGTVRTALFAWLVAKNNSGQFFLRIEDTDQARSVEGTVQNIIDTLNYIGIDWDEGPEKDGQYGPYLQSERLDIYKEWAEKLIKSGRAYADPNSQSELEVLRETAKKNKKPFLFRDFRPKNPPEWNYKMPLRFKSDPKDYEWDDAVMGKMQAGKESVDDFILIKSDGFPTYNFAHIVDDYLMEITHVIRSQEFISSVPKYLNLYEALEIPVPILATVPQVLADNGQRKLSKREGAKQLLEYKNMGILKEALVNFMATLGWNDGTDQEFFSIDELINKFDLKRVQKSGAHFDEKRLIWYNGHYIRQLKLNDLFQKVKDAWPEEAKSYDNDYKLGVLSIIQERLKYFAELGELTKFFFVDLQIDPDLINQNNKLKKLSKDEIKKLLEISRLELSKSDFSLDDLNNRLNKLLDVTKQNPATLFSLIRVATTQAPASPGLADTMHVLGKEVSLRRIDQLQSSLS